MSKEKRRKNKHLPPRFDVIEAAVNDDLDAIYSVLMFYEAYITRLSMIRLYDEKGNIHIFFDEEKKGRLEVKLLEKIPEFQLDKYL